MVPGPPALSGLAAIAAMEMDPWLLPTSLDLRAGSAPIASLRAEVAVLGLAAVLVVPAFAYLYWLQQHDRLGVSEASAELRGAVRAVLNRVRHRSG